MYVLTRPLGSSFADWLGKPSSAGGVGVGSGQVSLILVVRFSMPGSRTPPVLRLSSFVMAVTPLTTPFEDAIIWRQGTQLEC